MCYCSVATDRDKKMLSKVADLEILAAWYIVLLKQTPFPRRILLQDEYNILIP